VVIAIEMKTADRTVLVSSLV